MKTRILLFSVLLVCMSGHAVAGVITNLNPLATYGFTNLSANNVADAAAGEAQLSVQIFGWDSSASGTARLTTDLTETSVLFVFRNIGSAASSITDIYFDDTEAGTINTMAELIDADDNTEFNVTGVDFSQGASPKNLPSGKNATPEFETTAGLLADPDPPVEPNGVNPGEELGVVFSLKSGITVQDVIKSLNDALIGTGDDYVDGLRIGIHVQGFDGGGSETFINGNPDPDDGSNPVPEPASVVLMLLGGVGLLAYRRRQLLVAA